MRRPPLEAGDAVKTAYRWDWREQPPMEGIMAAVTIASWGTVRMSMPGTGSDEYELVIETVAPEPGAAASEAAVNERLREELRRLAARLMQSAAATEPSKKSDIENDVARKILAILETP